ncbi:MAG TPA: F0F1 ATP synthase subunit A [Clostridiales bacterium]|nr:F0F1 ATP synthase subunit A [Clostridiales bacterium]
MEVHGPHYFSVDILGLEIKISESVVVGWIVIAIITLLILFLTHNMKKIPSKKQSIAELIVTTVNKLVLDTMGKRNMRFAPYMAALFMFSIFGSLIGLFGLRPMTADYNTTLAWALITFFMIQICNIKASGIGGYLKGFTEPVAFMTPMNIVSLFVTPISLSFRHFGNIAGGMVISMLVYYALGGLSNALGLSVPLATIGIPAFLSIYFDLFSGIMQAFIFVMLSMVFIGSANESEE